MMEADDNHTKGLLPRIKESFDLYDSNGNGFVPTSCIGHIMRSSGFNYSYVSIYPFIINNAGLFPTDTEICELINFLDGNNQGEVQLGELSMAMIQQVINQEFL